MQYCVVLQMQVFCFVVVNGLWHLEHFLSLLLVVMVGVVVVGVVAVEVVFFFVILPIFFLTFRTAVVHTMTDATLVFVVRRLWGVAGSADTG